MSEKDVEGKVRERSSEGVFLTCPVDLFGLDMPAFKLIDDLRCRLTSLRKTYDPEAVALATECESLLAIIRVELEAVTGQAPERTPAAGRKSSY